MHHRQRVHGTFHTPHHRWQSTGTVASVAWQGLQHWEYQYLHVQDGPRLRQTAQHASFSWARSGLSQTLRPATAHMHRGTAAAAGAPLPGQPACMQAHISIAAVAPCGLVPGPLPACVGSYAVQIKQRNFIEQAHLVSDFLYLGNEAVHAAEAKLEGVCNAGLCAI